MKSSFHSVLGKLQVAECLPSPSTSSWSAFLSLLLLSFPSLVHSHCFSPMGSFSLSPPLSSCLSSSLLCLFKGLGFVCLLFPLSYCSSSPLFPPGLTSQAANTTTFLYHDDFQKGTKEIWKPVLLGNMVQETQQKDDTNVSGHSVSSWEIAKRPLKTTKTKQKIKTKTKKPPQTYQSTMASLRSSICLKSVEQTIKYFLKRWIHYL